MAAADTDPVAQKEAIRARALSLGFDVVGFARAELAPSAGEHLACFVGEGRHGDMAWMSERIDARSHPRRLWEDARTVIALGMNYGPEDNPAASAVPSDRGVIAAYARNRDYHDVIKGRLKNLAQWIARTGGVGIKVFVDTAPVMEKPLASAAGLGWQGKHTNLVSRRFGSWLFLGEILTTLELPPDEASKPSCGNCRRCLDACPTGALPEPWRLDARRCISYLTIEHEGAIPEELRPAIGNRIYGCDDCLAVCPWNRFAKASREAAFQPRAELTAPRLAELAALDDPAFRKLFSASPIKRIGRNRFVRNVLIALGNSGQSDLRGCVAALVGDPSPIVAEAARWAMGRLASGPNNDQYRNLGEKL